MLLYRFLTRNYEHIDVVFIRHHTVASEVDEDDFFTSRESGGTVVSSALVLMRESKARALGYAPLGFVKSWAYAAVDPGWQLLMAPVFATPKALDRAGLTTLVQRRAPLYDKSREGHFNLISALHKSVRGSDPDAALYWLARMLDGGEDPLYLARRLVRMAIEDIGLADPQALVMCNAAKDAYDFLGSPEGELAIAQAVIYLATAPKSNAAYTAYGAAMRAAKAHGSLLPPKHILNAPTKLMKGEGYGDGYRYDHDQPDAFSGQDYFPEKMGRRTFYDPPARGFERELRKRLDWWAKLRKERGEG